MLFLGYLLNFSESKSDYGYRFPVLIDSNMVKKIRHLDIKRVILQNILLELSTLNTNQQPKEQLTNK